MIIGEVEAVDRKQKIRDRYKGVDISELEVIPAKIIEDLETSSVIRRVAAYIRVSTDNDEQTSSYELQKNYYPEMVMKMKNQAADFICEKYNWDEVVKETMKLYRRK